MHVYDILKIIGRTFNILPINLTGYITTWNIAIKRNEIRR